MPLPVLFANLTAPTLPELDEDFAALGAITQIPCAVSGTNALTLTPAASTPTISAYNQYQTYVGIASAGNTGPATGAVGSLGALAIYKDGIGGPTALTGGEIVTGNAIFLTYDSALNSGAGGFHLGTGPGILAGGVFSGNIAAPSLTIPSGATASIAAGSSITRIRSTAVSLTWGVLTAGQTSLAAVTLAGISIGDVVRLGYPATLLAGIGYNGYVSSASVVTIEAFNYTPSSSLTPTGGFYRVAVEGFT